MYVLPYGQMSHWGNLFALNIIIIYKLNLIPISLKEDYNNHIKISITKRSQITNFIGPLNIDILSIIYGSLLGDAHAEKRKNGKGTRISFFQEGSHKSYLLYLHSLIANLGYCNTNIPKINTRLGSNKKIRKIIRFHTWTYVNFNWIYEDWYLNNKKIVPQNLELYLTPLALAIWIQDDGCKIGSGLKLATNNFKYSDLIFLISLLYKKYNLKTSIHKSNDIQYVIYIWAESMPILVDIVKPYIIPSMKYKLDKYI
jgi:ubiquinol-cytochrome c reductase cytochrome b subunit